MNTVEVTDPDVPEYEAWWDTDRHYIAHRPDETLADWIAKANPLGDVHIVEMAAFKNIGGERCPSKRCVLCSEDPESVREFAQINRHIRERALTEFGVEWDPTITF